MTKLNLKQLKEQITEIKIKINDLKKTNKNEGGNVTGLKKTLKLKQKQHRKLYMKIYSENYYKNNPDKVIKAVMKYQKTPKGKITKDKYNNSEKKKLARQRYELKLKAYKRQVKWRQKIA